MSAWSRSLYLDLAQQLACSAIAVNGAAGGATVFQSATDYYGALATVACQLNAANNALGASAVGLDFSSIPGLTQTIACLVQSMATGTGTGLSVPFGSYDMYAQWNAITCGLNQIAVNTGGASPGGLQGGSIYAFMSGAICSMNQIAANGFAPVDPVQAFINALNVFGWDVLLVGDRGTSTTTGGQPVSSWSDQSGNGNDASQVGTARPNYTAALLNGKAGLTFDGVNDFMLGPFVNAGDTLTDIVVYRGTNGASSARISTIGPTGVDEAGTALGEISLRFEDATTLDSFRTPVGVLITHPTTESAFHCAASLVSDAGGGNREYSIIQDGATTSAIFAGFNYGTDQYGIGASIAGNSFLAGDIVFRAVSTEDKSSDIAAILSLINTYYGL